MFHTFNQNNSGGSFDHNTNIRHYVIVEGNDRDDIIRRAEGVGIYFNGCDSGMDCTCCGDRWYTPWDGAYLDTVPSLYGKPVKVRDSDDKTFIGFLARDKGSDVVIHYKDGSRKYANYYNSSQDEDDEPPKKKVKKTVKKKTPKKTRKT